MDNTDTNEQIETASPSGSPAGSLQGAAQPYIDKAKGFAKQRPFAAAALVGVLGVALLNTLRGKGGRNA